MSIIDKYTHDGSRRTYTIDTSTTKPEKNPLNETYSRIVLWMLWGTVPLTARFCLLYWKWTIMLEMKMKQLVQDSHKITHIRTYWSGIMAHSCGMLGSIHDVCYSPIQPSMFDSKDSNLMKKSSMNSIIIRNNKYCIGRKFF